MHDSLHRLEVHTDGAPGSKCLFKVYLRGRTAAKEGFLRVLTPLHRSYVDWNYQDESCRAAFSSLVKSPEKTDGSELRRDITMDEVLRAIDEFASSTSPGTTPAG